jgi:hypothetical protein
MTNEELASAASASMGTPNPACIPYLGISLVRTRKAQEEEMDDDDMARRGDVVDAFGFNVSARPQPGHGGPVLGNGDKMCGFLTVTVRSGSSES